MKIEHLGIAVKDFNVSIPLFEQLLQTPCYKIEELAAEQVRTAFFRTGESKIELLESTDPHGVIAKFIAKRGEGLHHIAFSVEDLEAEISRLERAGFRILPGMPRPGADDKMICFLHPASTGGVLVELCAPKRSLPPPHPASTDPAS